MVKNWNWHYCNMDRSHMALITTYGLTAAVCWTTTKKLRTFVNTRCKFGANKQTNNKQCYKNVHYFFIFIIYLYIYYEVSLGTLKKISPFRLEFLWHFKIRSISISQIFYKSRSYAVDRSHSYTDLCTPTVNVLFKSCFECKQKKSVITIQNLLAFHWSIH